MSRPRYSIMPLQGVDGTLIYLFRDNDLTRSTNGGPVQFGVACHYDGEKRNWTKTLDPIEAIEICGDLNEQDEKLAKENRMANAMDRQLQRNHIPPLRTGGKGGFWPFGLFR
jgi:hypothetical protein